MVVRIILFILIQLLGFYLTLQKVYALEVYTDVSGATVLKVQNAKDTHRYKFLSDQQVVFLDHANKLININSVWLTSELLSVQEINIRIPHLHKPTSISVVAQDIKSGKKNESQNVITIVPFKYINLSTNKTVLPEMPKEPAPRHIVETNYRTLFFSVSFIFSGVVLLGKNINSFIQLIYALRYKYDYF